MIGSPSTEDQYSALTSQYPCPLYFLSFSNTPYIRIIISKFLEVLMYVHFSIAFTYWNFFGLENFGIGHRKKSKYIYTPVISTSEKLFILFTDQIFRFLGIIDGNGLKNFDMYIQWKVKLLLVILMIWLLILIIIYVWTISRISLGRKILTSEKPFTFIT